MAYDTELADRIRAELGPVRGVVEKQMFGGLAFLIGGHLAVSASGRGGLLLRCDPAETGRYLDPPHVGPFEMRGREMDGWLRVDAEAVRSDAELARWVQVGVRYASSLEPKQPVTAARRP